MTEVIRRKHFALNTEQSYCAWLNRYCHYLKKLPAHLPSEQKLERFLTALAKEDVAASTQNQAFNAIIFFYKEAMGVELKNVQALRARRPSQLRRAPADGFSGRKRAKLVGPRVLPTARLAIPTAWLGIPKAERA